MKSKSLRTLILCIFCLTGLVQIVSASVTKPVVSSNVSGTYKKRKDPQGQTVSTIVGFPSNVV